jgi:hypothetical protein
MAEKTYYDTLKGVNVYAGVPVEPDPNKGTGTVNYCKPGMMSTCSCPTKTKTAKWADHKACKFAIKSAASDRCQHFIMEKFCDSMSAQKANESKTKTLTECMGL